MATFEKHPASKPQRLTFTLPLAADTLQTLKEFIIQELTDAKAALFNNDNAALNSFLRALLDAGWRIKCGAIHNAGANDAYLMTLPFIDLENPATRPTGANVVTFGVLIREPTVTDQPQYLSNVDCSRVLIYSALGSNISLNLEFEQ